MRQLGKFLPSLQRWDTELWWYFWWLVFSHYRQEDFGISGNYKMFAQIWIRWLDAKKWFSGFIQSSGKYCGCSSNTRHSGGASKGLIQHLFSLGKWLLGHPDTSFKDTTTSETASVADVTEELEVPIWPLGVVTIAGAEVFQKYPHSTIKFIRSWSFWWKKATWSLRKHWFVLISTGLPDPKKRKMKSMTTMTRHDTG